MQLTTGAFLSHYPRPPPSLHCGESVERYAQSLGDQTLFAHYAEVMLLFVVYAFNAPSRH